MLHQLSVEEIKGVGNQKAALLRGLGINTVEDLLTYYPYRYDCRQLINLEQASNDELITVVGRVFGQPSLAWFGGKKSRLTVPVLVDEALITAVWFNRHYMKPRLVPGMELALHGKWHQQRKQLTVLEAIPRAQLSEWAEWLPVYSVGTDLTLKWFRKTLKTALEQYGHLIEDNLPQSVVSKYRLIGRKEALKQMHFPAGEEALHQAHRRLAYEEMLVFQLQMIWRRRQQQTQVKGIAHRFDEAAIEKFVEQLPFALTVSQRKVMTEILDDMKKPVMMNRLVQGDVGSGKTVIAAIALYAACLSGYQGAMMVPTEILAEQHEQTLKSLFARYPVEVARLTSGMPAGLKKQTHAQLQMGMVDVVVGTHALIQEEVTFRNIGLVITDEQHRFGVEQRGMLRAKGEFPDVLTMTATPIPRTLAITQFGDMEISVIDQLPEGRKPVKTYWVGTSRFNQVVAMLETTCRAGKQAYVICPLIEESDKLDLQDAVQLHQYLSEVLPDLHLGMLHGRMKNDEKEKLMRRFAGGEIAILVSTTVVEVGVNVPNATLMVIYNADRFGLSQLHQLRGRVGRGDDASVCVLVADPKTAAGRERMKLMTRTNNGFEIAEKDLQMRGPGDFFGVRQSGLPAFKVADLSRDYRIMVTAHRDAQLMLADPSFWQAVQYQWLRRQLTPNATVLD